MMEQHNLSPIHKKTIEVFGLDLRDQTRKGWIVGAECPFCHKDDKFGVRLNDPSKGRFKNHVSFNCFRGSCQSSGSEFALFKQINRLSELQSLFSEGKSIDTIQRVGKLSDNQPQQIERKDPQVRPIPFSFQRIYSHWYLDQRGFESWQYQDFTIGVCPRYSKLKDYVVFLVTQDGKNRGYVARSLKSKQWIDAENDRIRAHNKIVSKDERLPKYLRYINEGGADFDAIVFGIDQVNDFTTKIIAVEGLTSKANVDRWLIDRQLDHIVCVCTFGKKLSEDQLYIIMSHIRSNIDEFELIFMYDDDAIDSSKHHSIWTNRVIKTTNCFIKQGDPDDCSFEQLDQIFESRLSPYNFAINKVNKLGLKD